MGGLGAPTETTIADVVATLDEADDELAAAVFTDADRAITQRELRQAVALARHGAWRLARRHELPTPDDETLASDLARLREEQSVCWDARSRPGGREDSLGQLRD
jgi:hypothetical protein